MRLVSVKKIPRICSKITISPNNIKSIDKILGEMTDLCERYNGVGLAAPQVGIPLQMIVIRKSLSQYYKIINPEYLPINQELFDSTEGCLSIPNRTFIIKRFVAIQASGILLDKFQKPDNIFWKELSGFDGVVFQHEVGHCRGELISEIGIEIL